MNMGSNSPTLTADTPIGPPMGNNNLLTMMAQGFKQLTENFTGQFQAINKHIDKIEKGNLCGN